MNARKRLLSVIEMGEKMSQIFEENGPLVEQAKSLRDIDELLADFVRNYNADSELGTLIGNGPNELIERARSLGYLKE